MSARTRCSPSSSSALIVALLVASLLAACAANPNVPTSPPPRPATTPLASDLPTTLLSPTPALSPTRAASPSLSPSPSPTAPPSPWPVGPVRVGGWREVRGVIPELEPRQILDATMFDGRYIAVGYDGTRPAAWTSPDGETWQATIIARGRMVGRSEAVASGTSGVVASSDIGPNGTSASLWRSSDGTAWTRIDVGDLLVGASIRDLVATDTGFIAVGAGAERSGPGIWVSADGTDWHRSRSLPRSDGNGPLASVTRTADGYVAVGSNGEADAAASGFAWRSTDGETWTSLFTAPIERGPHRFTAVVSTPDLIVVGGDTPAEGDDDFNEWLEYGSTATVWTSRDGVSWDRAVLPRTGRRGSLSGLDRVGTDLIALGVGDDPQRPMIWRSGDGMTWTPLPDAITEANTGASVAVAAPDRILLLGSTVWSSEP